MEQVVGTTGKRIQTINLLDGDVITCAILNSQGSCPAVFADCQRPITMSVSPTPVLISIAATPGNMVCQGTNVIFTALPNNGGSNPGYQWKKNGINIGTNANTYNSNSLANGDTISCEMTIA
jgi:hypothetical protein